MKTYLRHVTTILLHILGVILVLILLLPKAVEGMVNLFKKYHQEPFRIIRFDEEKKRGYIGTFLIVNWLGMSKTAQNNRVFTYFLFPSLSAFSLFVALPFFQGLWFSLTNWTGLNTGHEVYIGFQNYKTIFSDYEFLYSFMRTAIYAVMNIIAINVVAFLLALLVTQKLKGKNLYRAAFFMPNLIGGLVLGYIWQFLFNRALIKLGGIFDPSLIVSGDTALLGLILVVTWQYAGYIMMIYVAALQNVPQDLIEASKIDGANSLQRLRTITFPMIAQSFTIAMFLTLTTSFKQFDTVLSLTKGGPATQLPLWMAGLFNLDIQPVVKSTYLMAMNIYDEAFVKTQMGIGQAKAIVFFVVLLIVSIVQVRYNQRREVEL
jgi:raffinose/stachyose/melibiose transport system permease protein